MYSSLRTVEDRETLGNVLVGETVFWFVVWLLIEAFIGDPVVDFARGFVSKTTHLFGSLGLDTLQSAWRWSMSWVYDLRFIGTGGFKNWLERGFYLWLCTGFPMILYNGYKSGQD